MSVISRLETEVQNSLKQETTQENPELFSALPDFQRPDFERLENIRQIRKQHHESLAWMEQLEYLVLKKGWPVPFSPYYLVDHHRLLDILDRLRASLQDELDTRFIQSFTENFETDPYCSKDPLIRDIAKSETGRELKRQTTPKAAPSKKALTKKTALKK